MASVFKERVHIVNHSAELQVECVTEVFPEAVRVEFPVVAEEADFPDLV